MTKTTSRTTRQSTRTEKPPQSLAPETPITKKKDSTRKSPIRNATYIAKEIARVGKKVKNAESDPTVLFSARELRYLPQYIHKLTSADLGSFGKEKRFRRHMWTLKTGKKILNMAVAQKNKLEEMVRNAERRTRKAEEEQ